jgi:5-methylcytosine-specific restriction enzyme subunit McrC
MVSVVHKLARFNYSDTKTISEDTSPLDIYSIVLVNWVEFLIKKGLYRSYLLQEELIPGIKGKYLIEKNLIQKGKFWCNFDEISFNTIENIIIKSTLIQLIQTPLSDEVKQRILTVIRLFSSIDHQRLTKELFQQPIYHRLNYHYKTIIDLCYLIYRNLRLTDDTGINPFSGYLVNMNRLFQDFILKSLISLFPSEKISPSRKLSWAIPLKNSENLPVLEPDILIEGKYVIDAKYYNSPINDRNKFHSEHLYQLITYMQSYNLNGMLVYPENDQPLNESFKFKGNIFTIKTINLKQSVHDLNNSIKDIQKFYHEIEMKEPILN